jgi:hypothetical protein
MNQSVRFFFQVLFGIQCLVSTVLAQTLLPPENLTITALSQSEKPTSSNTGWLPTGVTLAPSGSLNITTDGTVIDSKDISGTITIKANNVTIKRSRVRSDSYYPIVVKSGTNIIEDTEVDGLGGSSKAIYINGNVTVQRCNIHNSEDGLSLNGNGGITIRDNWVHNPQHSSEGHSDGFEIYSGAHMTIAHNNFDYAGAITSASNFPNWAGPIDDVVYDSNWLSGGSFNLYVDGSFAGGPISNVQITNNRFVRNSAAFGTHLVRGNISNITWAGNVYDDNDATISR